jgi:hypothetical protein
MSNNTPSYDYNFITTEDLDNEFDKELEDLDKVYTDYVENEKEYIKFIKEKTLNQLRNRRRSFQSPLSPTPQNNSPQNQLPIITNIPKSNIKQILAYKNQNKNPIIENRNLKSIYLTRLSFFGIVFAVNLMYYLIYYDYLNLKRLTYN